MITFREPWYMHTLAIAMRLHMGQVDRSGAPYWKHLQSGAFRLADRFPDATRDQIEAALLHDVLEDTRTEANQLRGHGVRPRVVEIVQAVTRDDPARLAYPGQDAAFVAKYGPARAILEAALS